MKTFLGIRLLVNVPKDRRESVAAAVKEAIASTCAALEAAGAKIEGESHEVREAFRDETLQLGQRRLHLYTGKGIPTRRASPETACGNWASGAKLTTQKDQVTCQLCLRRVRQWERVERPEEQRVSGAGEDCLDCYHPFRDHNLNGSCRTCKLVEEQDPKGDRFDPPHEHRCLSARPGEEPEPPRKRGRVHIAWPDRG